MIKPAPADVEFIKLIDIVFPNFFVAVSQSLFAELFSRDFPDCFVFVFKKKFLHFSERRIVGEGKNFLSFLDLYQRNRC